MNARHWITLLLKSYFFMKLRSQSNEERSKRSDATELDPLQKILNEPSQSSNEEGSKRSANVTEMDALQRSPNDPSQGSNEEGSTHSENELESDPLQRSLNESNESSNEEGPKRSATVIEMDPTKRDKPTCNIDQQVLVAIILAQPEMLKQLLKDNPDYKISKKALPTIMARLLQLNDVDFPGGQVFEQCFNIIMEAIPQSEMLSYVNYKDADGLVPLEYLAIYEDYYELGPMLTKYVLDAKGCNLEAIAFKLIRAGASFANEDKEGSLIINRFTYERLKRYFDTCIKKGRFGILEFNFGNILPSRIQDCPEDIDVDVLQILLVISNSYALRGLLMHPLISMFLIYMSHFKWASWRSIFYINVGFYIIFYCTLVLQIANWYYTLGNVWPYLLVTTCLLAAREILQIVIAPRMYFKNAENYMEILIVVLTISASSVNNRNITDQLIVFAFLFSTFELLFLAGRHLILIKYILLFKAVVKIFSKLLVFFIITIIAFALSFNILFSPKIQQNSNSTNEFFSNPLISVFKTIIMTTGEYETGSINFNNHPIGSHIALLLFVIIVPIILMNLILGLAVCDIQRMEKHSRLHGHVAIIEFLHQAETILRNPKVSRVFNSMGKIHKLFNLSERMSSDNKMIKNTLQVTPHSELFDFVSQLAQEAEEGQMRQEVWRLTQVVERMDEKLTKLQEADRQKS